MSQENEGMRIPRHPELKWSKPIGFVSSVLFSLRTRAPTKFSFNNLQGLPDRTKCFSNDWKNRGLI